MIKKYNEKYSYQNSAYKTKLGYGNYFDNEIFVVYYSYEYIDSEKDKNDKYLHNIGSDPNLQSLQKSINVKNKVSLICLKKFIENRKVCTR